MDHEVVPVGAGAGGVPEDGLLAELATAGTRTRIKIYKEVTVNQVSFTLHEVDDRKRRLAVVVCKEKAKGGGSMAPRLTNSTTPEDVLSRQPNEYLTEDDKLRQVVKDSLSTDVRHDEVFCLKKKRDMIEHKLIQ
jgi:hypothetical protein